MGGCGRRLIGQRAAWSADVSATELPLPPPGAPAAPTRAQASKHVLTTTDLTWPLFLIDSEKRRAPVATMPDCDHDRCAPLFEDSGGHALALVQEAPESLYVP